MSYVWNAAPVAEWDSIKDPDTWNQHLAAVQERADVVDPNISVGTGDPLPVTDDTPTQKAAWWSGKTPIGNPIPTPDYRGMQATLTDILGVFIDHRSTIEGSATPPAFWDIPTLRTAAGLPSLYQLAPTIYADGSSYGYSVPNLAQTLPAPLPANSSWRRCRPREAFIETITFLPDYAFSDNYDTQSNAAAVGQHAWRIDTDGNPAGSWLYTCSATGTHGTWDRETPRSGALPLVDRLDNATDAPTCITLDSNAGTIFGAFSIQAYAGYSSMVNPGDYVGYWLFAEVRAITNLLRWQSRVPLDTPVVYYASVTSSVSYADALSLLAAAWAPGGTAPGRGSGAYISAAYDPSGPTWSVTASRWSTVLNVGFSAPLPAKPKQVDFYLLATKATDGAWVFAAPTTDTFDTQGDDPGLIEGGFHLIETSAITSATSIDAAKFGDELTVPPNAPDDPATAGPGRKGYETPNALAVIRFDVAGGFAYVF